MDPEDLVVVATFRTAAEAELAKEILDNEGIPAFLGNEMSANLMPYLSSDLVRITLQVSQKNADRARDMLTPPAPSNDRDA